MKHNGVSLIELLLTMSACTVILTMSAALVHRIMHVQSGARAIADGERTALRLSEHFRRDVGAATSADAESAGDEGSVILRLKLAGGQSIEYRRSEGSVLRIVHENDAVRGREQFAFGGEIEVTVRDEAPGLVTLAIRSAKPDSAADAGEEIERFRNPALCLQATARLNRFSPGTLEPQEAAP